MSKEKEEDAKQRIFGSSKQPRPVSSILFSLGKNIGIAAISFAVVLKSAEVTQKLIEKEDKDALDYLKGGGCIVSYFAGTLSGIGGSIATASDAISLGERGRDLKIFNEMKEAWEKKKQSKEEEKQAS